MSMKAVHAAGVAFMAVGLAVVIWETSMLGLVIFSIGVLAMTVTTAIDFDRRARAAVHPNDR